MTVTSSFLWKTDSNSQDASSPDRGRRGSDLRREFQVKETIWVFCRKQRQISQESCRKWEREQPRPLGANSTQGTATGSGARSGDELVPKTLGAVRRARHCPHHRHASQVRLPTPRTGWVRPCLNVLSRVNAWLSIPVLLERNSSNCFVQMIDISKCVTVKSRNLVKMANNAPWVVIQKTPHCKETVSTQELRGKRSMALRLVLNNIQGSSKIALKCLLPKQ